MLRVVPPQHRECLLNTTNWLWEMLLHRSSLFFYLLVYLTVAIVSVVRMRYHPRISVMVVICVTGFGTLQLLDLLYLYVVMTGAVGRQDVEWLKYVWFNLSGYLSCLIGTLGWIAMFIDRPAASVDNLEGSAMRAADP